MTVLYIHVKLPPERPKILDTHAVCGTMTQNKIFTFSLIVIHELFPFQVNYRASLEVFGKIRNY